MCLIERLSNPFGNRHAARVRGALDLAVLRILKDHLESFSRRLSIFGSLL